MKYSKVCTINNPVLAKYINRTRSGSEQVFYTGNDSRDFKRYQREGQKEMHDKPDTIRINPPKSHYYAELIEGEWWWVNGCAGCNGDDTGWCYRKCDEHDVCDTCKCSRQELTETPWGTRTGWQCKPCAKKEADIAKQEALQKVAEREYEPYDYLNQDNVICPHCATEFENMMDDGEPEANQECEVCGGEFSLEVEYNVTFYTKVIGERLKPEVGHE